MEINVKGIILDVVSKEYEFNGRKGVSHKVHVYSNGKVQKIKINQKEISFFENLKNEEYEFKCNIFIDGRYNLNLI